MNEEARFNVLTHNLQNNEYTVIIADVKLDEALSFMKLVIPRNSHQKVLEYVIREV